MHFCEVMHNTVKEPLGIHLAFPSQGESVQSQYGIDMGEGRLRYPKSPVVKKSALYRIYLLPHLLAEGFRHAWRSPLNKTYLTHLAYIGISQTPLPHFACPAVCLSAPKFDGGIPVQNHIAAATIQALSGRTDAEPLVFAQCKILRSVQHLCPVKLSLFPTETLLVFVHIRKPRIAFSKLGIRYVGVNAFFHYHKGLSYALYHRFKQIVFLRRPECLCMYDYLMLVIYRRHAVISLYHSVGGLYLCAFVVRDVALDC